MTPLTKRSGKTFFCANMNGIDRAARGLLGLFLIAISPIGLDILGTVIGWFGFFFGLANLIASATSWCFMYSVIGLTSIQGQDDSDIKEVDFQSLRNRSVFGFGAIAVLVSGLFIGAGYESGRDTIRTMELRQLHNTINQIYLRFGTESPVKSGDYLEPFLKESMTNSLLTSLKTQDVPLFVVAKQNNLWLNASTLTSQTHAAVLEDEFRTSLAMENIDHAIDHHHGADEDNTQYFFTVENTLYSATFHDFPIQDQPPVRVILAQKSLSDGYVVGQVFARLLTSSVVVIWIAVWGAIGISYFMWQRIDRSNRQVQVAANTDPQTGLLNERALEKALSDLTKSHEPEAREFAVCATKFRSLSQILANNSSTIATKVLKNLADKLRAEIGYKAPIARLNDGTFLIVAPKSDISSIDIFTRIINETQHVDDYQFSLDPTVAEVIYPTDVNCYEKLISSISILIFGANKQRLSFIKYNQDLIKRSQKSLRYSAELKNAIASRQFELYLQPKYDMVTNKVFGAEALVRWNHPQDGILSPFHFLDLVEQSNSRSEFACFVIKEAARIARYLAASGNKMPISFNLNGYDVVDCQVVRTLEKLSPHLAKEDIQLEIELTESETSLSAATIAAQLSHLSKSGFSISLDDFGTGMSSFSFTHTLPIHTIKIDRSFIWQLNQSNTSKIPIKTILYLANNYGYKVVAEGVETKEQADMLVNLGCRVCQGFYYAKPMTLHDFHNALAKESR